MDVERKRAYNRDYYWRNREKRLAQQKAYWRDYKSKGLRKPRKRQPRSIRDHERYMEHREEILAKQKIYRETHKDEIKARRRQRILNNIRNHYERREQQHTAGREDGGANQVGHVTSLPVRPTRGLS